MTQQVTQPQSTGNLPALPKGWVWTVIGEMTDTIPLSGKKLKRSEYQEEGKVPVVDQGQSFVGGYTDREDMKIGLEQPVIVFGDHTKALKYVDFDFVAGADGIKVIKPKEVFHPRLFYYFVRAIQLPEKGYARHFQFLEKSLIPLPPLPEQHRIVAKVEELFTDLDAGIEVLNKVKVQLKRYHQAVLKHAFEGKLTAEWREAHKHELEPASQLLTRIGTERNRTRKRVTQIQIVPNAYRQLPSEWEYASVQDITTLVTDGEHITPKRNDSGVLLLSARNIRDGHLSLKTVDHIAEDEYQRISKRLCVQEDDVLLSCSGTVGRTCVAPPNLRFGLVRSVAVLRPCFGMGKYVSYALRSPFLQEQIIHKKTQTAQANIFQGKIRQLTLPIAPMKEQQRIVEEIELRLSIADEVERIMERSLSQAGRLRQSILRRAFEGKLVPQDPSDEPADKLLERIREERAK